ncbi:MAG: fibronectin type III domain-containing protein [Chloroflexi bacterium]|nr:MAG: fibronectin type III domain-containing protein [Chloroflexota bacterium]
MKKGIFALVGMLILFPLIAPMQARAAGTLMWNPSTGTVQGYKVYYGTTSKGPYTNSATAGTATSYALNNLPLQEKATYYFVLRAYNQAGESANSNEISHSVTDSTPPAPPKGVTAN